MINRSRIIDTGNFIQRYFAFFLSLIYFFSIFFPEIGIFADHYSFFYINFPGKQAFQFTTPMLMLGIIVLIATLSINLRELLSVRKNVPLVIMAILVNFILGIIFFLLIKIPLSFLISNNDLQQIIIGIAILTAIPIAGTATAWTQVIRGNVTLTLQILLSTTLLSPIFVPLILKFFSFFTNGIYTEKILMLADRGADLFLTLIVVIPAIIGLIVYFILGNQRIVKLMPYVRVLNQFNLLFLIYMNASVILPNVVSRNHDRIMIIICLILSIIYCFLSYFMGWIISIMFNSPLRDEVALIFSEGMKNVAAGLVIARFGFPGYHNIGLLIIFFAVAQQFMASFVKLFEYKKLIFIRNNDSRLSCIIDPDCKNKS